MKTDRDATRIVRSWLEDGVTQLPDRVLDDVLGEIPAVPQRRSSWGGANLPKLSRAAQVGLATAAVLVAVAMGLAMLPSGPGLGGPIGGQTPTPAPTPKALPQNVIALEAGVYVVTEPFPVRATLEVPSGWTACFHGPQEAGACRPDNSGVTVVIVENVVSDPCDESRPLLVPPVGPSVDDLVVALSNLDGFGATEPVAVTVGGFDGMEFELSAPEPGFCSGPISTWSDAQRTNAVSAREVNLVRIVDVAGTRLLIAAAYQPSRTSADELAEIRRVFDSVHFAP
jgi:hypothetical protein